MKKQWEMRWSTLEFLENFHHNFHFVVSWDIFDMQLECFIAHVFPQFMALVRGHDTEQKMQIVETYGEVNFTETFLLAI